jgi:16S rRNA (guanine527-N7)-methyltransferase
MTQRAVAWESKISLYIEHLARWSARMNLVGPGGHDALRRHVAESLAAADHLPIGAHVVDLGSGAGFPGVPILIVRPDLRMTLVDSRERRIHFLRHVARHLPLDCAITRTRIENTPPERFEFALLRAVAPLKKALEMAAPWVVAGGEVWVWTREQPEVLAQVRRGQISLGERGWILRADAAAVSRGTS